MYELTLNNLPTTLPGGNVTIPNPVPTNAAQSSFTLSGLTTGTWGIKVYSVSMAGLRCTNPSTLQWQIITTAPNALVTVQPDSASGSKTPVFQLEIDGANVTAAALGNITFQVALLGDAALGSFHVPAPCGSAELLLPTEESVNSPAGLVSPLGPLQRDCRYGADALWQ